jgi:hypothetical protein
MDTEISDGDRETLVRYALTRLGRDELKSALGRASGATPSAPKAAVNAINALGKHRDPAEVMLRPQYRMALPFVAAVVADDCLSRTIEALGDHSGQPTREQLLEALAEIDDEFPKPVIGVMLASVADGDMEASDLCFEVATTDERFGLTGWEAVVRESAPSGPADRPDRQHRPAPTPEERAAHRLQRREEAEERKKRQAEARRAGAARRARRAPREGGPPGVERPGAGSAGAVERGS